MLAVSPINTLSGALISTCTCGRVLVVRVDAWARNMTSATLPISPSERGISFSVIRESAPGASVPKFQRNDPSAAGSTIGVISTNSVPVGI